MKKFFWILLAVLVTGVTYSCSNDDDDNYVDLSKYQDWKVQNEQWVEEMQNRKNPDGTPYYTTIVPDWNKGSFILMHYFNDRSETAENLSPLYTSYVDVRYIGYNCQDEPFDSSTVDNSYGTLGIRRFACNGVIQGWSIALMDMHVGDTAEVVIPYEVAYGTSYTGAVLPYSALRFNIRLADIYRYEAPLK